MVTEKKGDNMATRTKEDNEILRSLSAVLNQLEEADLEIEDALRSESKWRASKAASAYKKELQVARLQVEKIDAALRKVNRLFL